MELSIPGILVSPRGVVLATTDSDLAAMAEGAILCFYECGYLNEH